MLARARSLFAAEIGLSGETITVTVHGEVDLYTAPMFWAWLVQGLRCAPARLVVDLGDVSFIDCAGVGVISRAADLMSGVVQIVLRSPNALAYKVLKLTGLDERCSIELKSPPSAVGAERLPRAPALWGGRPAVDLGPSPAPSEARVLDLRAFGDEEPTPTGSSRYGCGGYANGSRRRPD